MNKNKFSFWTNPNGFSIVDVIALSYSMVYLGLIVSNIVIQKILLTDLLQTMTPPIMAILGGYFTGQVVQQYNLTREYKQKAANEESESQDKLYKAPEEIKNQPYYKGDNTGFGTEIRSDIQDVKVKDDLETKL